MKKQFVLMAMAVITATALICNANAQQTKRNLIANSCFEDGFTNWRIDLWPEEAASFVIDEDEPISGYGSAKITLFERTESSWDVNLFYFMPIEEFAKYKLSFKAKATAAARVKIEVCRSHGSNDYWPIGVSQVPDGWIVEHDADILRGTFPVDTEVKEYTFITTGTQLGYWNYTLAFHFGHSDEGVSYWIDDIKMSRIDDGDWDGNLFPQGDFESEDERIDGSRGFWLDGWEGSDCTVEISSENPVSGAKSAHFYKGYPDPEFNFWGSSYNLGFWNNENVNYEVRLKAKVSQPGKLMVRTHFDPWGYDEDLLNWEIDATTTAQEFVLTRENAVFANENYIGYDGGQYGWNGPERYTGQQRLFGSFIGQHPTPPNDTHIWIDDIQVHEIVSLQDFTITQAPASVDVGEQVQFTIGEFVTPTHAPARVEFSVINGTGSATIDPNGVLTGVKAGTVTVIVSTPNGSKEKTFPVEVTGGSVILDVNASEIKLSEAVVSAGDVISIFCETAIQSVNLYNLAGGLTSSTYNQSWVGTAGLSSGTYLVKIQTGSGLECVRKIIVK